LPTKPNSAGEDPIEPEVTNLERSVDDVSLEPTLVLRSVPVKVVSSPLSCFSDYQT